MIRPGRNAIQHSPQQCEDAHHRPGSSESVKYSEGSDTLPVRLGGRCSWSAFQSYKTPGCLRWRDCVGSPCNGCGDHHANSFSGSKCSQSRLMQQMSQVTGTCGRGSGDQDERAAMLCDCTCNCSDMCCDSRAFAMHMG